MKVVSSLESIIHRRWASIPAMEITETGSRCSGEVNLQNNGGCVLGLLYLVMATVINVVINKLIGRWNGVIKYPHQKSPSIRTSHVDFILESHKGSYI